MADPRLYQIGTLASLLVYGIGWLDFDITVPRVVLLLTTVLATQWVCDRLAGGGARFGPRDAPPGAAGRQLEGGRRAARSAKEARARSADRGG